MRIVALSDIHGNLAALEAVLAAVTEPPDEWIVAGDLVAFGPQPGAVVDRVRALNARVVKGNLDDYTVDPASIQRLHDYAEAEIAAGRPFRPVMPLPLLEAQVAWTRAQLSPDQLSYLRGLPLHDALTLPNGSRILVIHANAFDLERPLLPGQPLDGLLDIGGWDAVIYGHVHVPSVTIAGECRLINVASAGFPTDGIPQPAYTEIALKGDALQITQHRIAYDLSQAEAAIRGSGQPEPDGIVSLLRSARRVR